LYDSDGDSDGDDDVRGGGVDCDNWAKRTDPVLDSVSDLYSKLDIFSVRACGTLLVCLTLSTDYFLTTALIEL